jgi:predicted dehydrogenase
MKLRMVVVGCGYITQASHGPAYRRLAAEIPGLELAACCDIDARRAEETRLKFGFERAYRDVWHMLETEQPDAVGLIVPVHFTAGLSEQIIRAGFPVLSEKPPAMTLDEIDRLICIAAETGMFHQVAFNRRFAPLAQELKRRLEGRHILHVAHTFTRVQRRDVDFSTTAIHGIDTLRWLLGADYRSLQFSYPVHQVGQDLLTAFVVDGSFSTGASVQMLFQPFSGASLERTVIYTPDETLELRLNAGGDAPGSLLIWRSGQLVESLDAAIACGSSEDFVVSGFYAENGAFLQGLQTHTPVPGHDFASARQSVELMQCLRERRLRYDADKQDV